MWRKALFQSLLFAPLICYAGARHFTFLYEAPTSAPGSVEIENYATTRFADERFADASFRHEVELGLTPRLQLGFYVANWSYTAGERARYDSSSVEAILNFANPVTDPIGLSLYQEIGGGRRALESETKLIAQRNFGPVIVLYNLTAEAGWQGEGLREREGELSQALGASYDLTPRLSLGFELLHEIVLPEWKSSDADHNLFLGPNISYRAPGWFATLTGLVQATETEREPDCQVRLIVGFDL